MTSGASPFPAKSRGDRDGHQLSYFASFITSYGELPAIQ
jgi:hypothetical protein